MNSKIVSSIQKLGGKVYRVGGSVRDELLGLGESDVKDHDFVVTGVPFDNLERTLAEFGKVNAVGKSFGVLKLKLDGIDGEFDVALPRKERSTGEGHRDFEVDFDHEMPIEEDLGRRDFTVNALAIQLGEDQQLIDPFNGKKDLEHRVIRRVFVNAFEEDPLRILRAVQFVARFSRLRFRIEADTVAAMRVDGHRLRSVSGERIFEEIKKIMLRAEFPSIAFKLMQQNGLLDHVLPELNGAVGVSQPNKYHSLDVFNHIMHAVDSVPSVELHVRLAALFHDIAKPQTRTDDNGEIHFLRHEFEAEPIIRTAMHRWAAPNELIEKIVLLVKNHMFALDFDMSRRAIRRLIGRVGEDLIHDLIDLRIGDRLASGKAFLSMGKVGRMRDIVEEELAEPAFSLKHLSIGGHDLIKMGLAPGPIFKKILHEILEKVMDDPSLNNKDTLVKLAAEIVEQEKVLD